MNLTDHTLLTIRMEMQQRGWVQKAGFDDSSHDWAATPHWRCTDLTEGILLGYRVAGLTQLDLHPVVVDATTLKIGDDVFASCFVKADGSLTGWCMCESYACTTADFNAHAATLDHLPDILAAWSNSWSEA